VRWMGGFLRFMHLLSALLMIGAVVIGYAAARGPDVLGFHAASGFFIAIVIGFTHAMTLFWFAGLGVGMREAARGAPASGDRSGQAYLDRASRSRRRVATPLGIALVLLMAATILGGGSHTRMIPDWPHHVLSIAALISNLIFNGIAAREILTYQALVRRCEAFIEGAR